MKKIFFLAGFVAVIGIIVTILFAMKSTGTVTFKSEPGISPYTITTYDGEEFICEGRTCSFEFVAGEYDFFIEKEGYYAVQEIVSIAKKDNIEIDVVFDVVPGLIEDTDEQIDESVFDVCYGDTVECGLSDTYFISTDEETGYMALWEGDERRATFTNGFEETKIFVGENGALVYDSGEGAAYFVDFIADSRSYLFNVEELDGVMFLTLGDTDEYLIEAYNVVYWWHNNSLESLLKDGGLEKCASAGDGQIYFIAEEGIGSYDGIQYYTILESVDVDLNDAVMGSDGEGIYVKNGEKRWRVVEGR